MERFNTCEANKGECKTSGEDNAAYREAEAFDDELKTMCTEYNERTANVAESEVQREEDKKKAEEIMEADDPEDLFYSWGDDDETALDASLEDFNMDLGDNDFSMDFGSFADFGGDDFFGDDSGFGDFTEPDWFRDRVLAKKDEKLNKITSLYFDVKNCKHGVCSILGSC